MSDLIDRQAALDALIFDVRADRQNGKTLMVRYAEEVLKRIKALPSAQPERKWIPTKVKPDPDLPEDDMSGYFLVTLHTYGNIGFDMDEYEVKKMRWDRVNGWVFPVHSPAWIEEALTQEVLAWKPCPEPYREDGVE